MFLGLGCGEVRDLCFGVLFVNQGTYFITFVCLVVYSRYENGGSFCLKATEVLLPREIHGRNFFHMCN